MNVCTSAHFNYRQRNKILLSEVIPINYNKIQSYFKLPKVNYPGQKSRNVNLETENIAGHYLKHMQDLLRVDESVENETFQLNSIYSNFASFGVDNLNLLRSDMIWKRVIMDMLQELNGEEMVSNISIAEIELLVIRIRINLFSLVNGYLGVFDNTNSRLVEKLVLVWEFVMFGILELTVDK